MHPTLNYFYKNLCRNKSDIYSGFNLCLAERQWGREYVAPAFFLRYVFIVSYGDVNKPPFPPEQMAAIRAFLDSSFADPQRQITLDCDTIEKLMEAVNRYRICNRDNRRIVLAHTEDPDARCGLLDETLEQGRASLQERMILHDVLNLIPDAKPE